MGEKDGEKKAADGGEKKAVDGGEKKVVDGGEKKAADGGEKKDEGPITAVLKLDLHCEGCAKKDKRAVSHFEGVEEVKAECGSNKLTVTGRVDPAWLRPRVEYKTKKKVELISPQAKKDGAAAAEKLADKKAEENIKSDDKKPKEPAVATVVMKIRLHCDGCAHKIMRVILKNIDGVDSVKTDLDKDLVTVTGTIDVKELIAYLKDKLKRAIEIISPKKDEAAAAAMVEASGEKKPVTAANELTPIAAASKAGEGTKVEGNKSEHNSIGTPTHFAMPMYNSSYSNRDYGLDVHHPPGYANHGYSFNYDYPQMGYVGQYSQGPPHPPPTYLNTNHQRFSDENPDGCSVM